MAEEISTLWLITGTLLLRHGVFRPEVLGMLFRPTSAAGKASLWAVVVFPLACTIPSNKVAIAGTPLLVLSSVPLATFILIRLCCLNLSRTPVAR